MPEPTAQAILSINSQEQAVPKSQTGWTIFWLIAFTPIGWYLTWRKTSWPISVKIAVTAVTALILIGLTVEAELISSQIGAGLSALPQ